MPFARTVASLLVMFGMGTAFSQSSSTQTLAAARAMHPMEIAVRTRDGAPPPIPPKGVLEIVHYRSPAGVMAAYVTPHPSTPDRHPAIIWISGGDSNTIGDFWTPQPATNDQTASAFRRAGIVEMYPSMRGGNNNPGFREYFYGEVDDILAAADYLAQQPYVDPSRIYLGGHSTGGTLALLVAEKSARFRATFAFGPVPDVRSYGHLIPVALNDENQARLRSPAYWLGSIHSSVFVFEGDHQANTDALQALARINHNPRVQFHVVPRATHFSTLAPATALIAGKIVNDSGTSTNIRFSDDELSALIR